MLVWLINDLLIDFYTTRT